MQKIRNSSALALELRLFCIKPSICITNNKFKFVYRWSRNLVGNKFPATLYNPGSDYWTPDYRNVYDVISEAGPWFVPDIKELITPTEIGLRNTAVTNVGKVTILADIITDTEVTAGAKLCGRWETWINIITSGPRQNGSQFTDDILKFILLYEKYCIFIQICFKGSIWPRHCFG